MDQQQQQQRASVNDVAIDPLMTDKICIRDLTVRNIIGVDAWERSKRQPIIINLTVYTSVSQAGDTDHLVGYQILYSRVLSTHLSFEKDNHGAMCLSDSHCEWNGT